MHMATRNGAQNLGLNTGGLATGEWADFLVVDINDPSMWPWFEEEPETLLWNFLLSSAPRACIRHVYVGGRQVVRDGSLATLNLEEAIGGRRALSSRIRGE